VLPAQHPPPAAASTAQLVLPAQHPPPAAASTTQLVLPAQHPKAAAVSTAQLLQLAQHLLVQPAQTFSTSYSVYILNSCSFYNFTSFLVDSIFIFSYGIMSVYGRPFQILYGT
jgi:hypothetical protein